MVNLGWIVIVGFAKSFLGDTTSYHYTLTLAFVLFRDTSEARLDHDTALRKEVLRASFAPDPSMTTATKATSTHKKASNFSSSGPWGAACR